MPCVSESRQQARQYGNGFSDDQIPFSQPASQPAKPFKISNDLMVIHGEIALFHDNEAPWSALSAQKPTTTTKKVCKEKKTLVWNG